MPNIAAAAALALSACAQAENAGSATRRPQVRRWPAWSTSVPSRSRDLRVVRSRGVAWTYDQVLPDSYDGSAPGPLVLDFGPEQRPAHKMTVDVEPIAIRADEPSDDHTWAADEDDLRLVATARAIPAGSARPNAVEANRSASVRTRGLCRVKEHDIPAGTPCLQRSSTSRSRPNGPPVTITDHE